MHSVPSIPVPVPFSTVRSDLGPVPHPESSKGARTVAVDGGTEIFQNFAGVADLHSRLVSGEKAIRDTLDRIEAQVAPLVATWSGEAQADYVATQQRWNRAEAGLIQVLQDIGRIVSSGNDDMMATERRNQARFPG